jgi:hypothetical protein
MGTAQNAEYIYTSEPKSCGVEGGKNGIEHVCLILFKRDHMFCSVIPVSG